MLRSSTPCERRRARRFAMHLAALAPHRCTLCIICIRRVTGDETANLPKVSTKQVSQAQQGYHSFANSIKPPTSPPPYLSDFLPPCGYENRQFIRPPLSILSEKLKPDAISAAPHRLFSHTRPLCVVTRKYASLSLVLYCGRFRYKWSSAALEWKSCCLSQIGRHWTDTAFQHLRCHQFICN